MLINVTGIHIIYVLLNLGLPDSRAWGQRRSKYYGTDVVDNRIGKCGRITELVSVVG